jgi:hypothetical protein
MFLFGVGFLFSSPSTFHTKTRPLLDTQEHRKQWQVGKRQKGTLHFGNASKEQPSCLMPGHDHDLQRRTEDASTFLTITHF